MSNENEILTIAGKRVKVRRCVNAADCCDRCCFIDRSSPRGCFARDNEKGNPACWYYEGEAYFVPAEDSETDLDAEIFAWQKAHATEETKQIIAMTSRHFAEWERKRILDKVVEWMKKNLTYVHPRKGVETCMVNIPAFLDAMNE